MRRNSLFALAVAFTALCVVSTVAVAAPARLAEPLAGSSSIEWQLNASFESAVLTVSTPSGAVIRREFLSGQVPSFNLFDQKGQTRPAGNYNYELRAVPAIDAAVRNRLAAARAAGDDRAAIAEQARAGLRDDLVQSGSFAIVDGAFAMGGAAETPGGPRNANAAAMRNVTAADQVIPDDLIVQGSTCVGFDCVNNESFGFDTIRLKENNLRIHFEDTSVGSFPTNDWRLIANDSASGGSSKFSIEDSTGVKTPFTITAGAATNSIFLDSTGRLGLRTSTPVLDVHISTSNTPAIRLEQNSSGGFTAQTWDIAGNEANFFVRDVTAGSRLPFRIRPGAPTSSVDISADGDVGVGTASPDTKLHVTSSGAANTDGKLLVENTSGTALQREMTEFRNNGGVSAIFEDTSVAQRWVIGTNGANFIWNEQANPGIEMTLSNTGNLTITGIYSPPSSREVKNTFVPVEPREVLQKVLGMPITTWNYDTDPATRHIGPMAEDFYSAFEVGIDNKHLSPTDSVGVALAAIQGMHQELVAKNTELESLRREVAALRELVEMGLAKQ